VTSPPVRQAVTADLPRHRHAQAYAAVVLSGGYEEAGDQGRRRVGPGDVVVHAAWEAHLNRVPTRGAQVLNLPAPASLTGFGRVEDLDGLVRLHERSPAEAAQSLLAEFSPAPPGSADWPDHLAQALPHDDRPLRSWAESLRLDPAHLSRRFRAVFGVGPQRFRCEARARAAWREVVGSTAPLAQIALALGFADQAHMTRAVRALTGRPPGAWRASTAFKTLA
jgi:AraC-like DNA-binding protein